MLHDIIISGHWQCAAVAASMIVVEVFLSPQGTPGHVSTDSALARQSGVGQVRAVLDVVQIPADQGRWLSFHVQRCVAHSVCGTCSNLYHACERSHSSHISHLKVYRRGLQASPVQCRTFCAAQWHAVARTPAAAASAQRHALAALRPAAPAAWAQLMQRGGVQQQRRTRSIVASAATAEAPEETFQYQAEVRGAA